MFYCKFTPEKVASAGNNRVIATIDGKFGVPAYLGATLWFPKKSATNAVQAILPQQVHLSPLNGLFEYCMFSTHMYHINTDLHWWISSCETSGVKNLMRIITNMATELFLVTSVQKSLLTSPYTPYANQFPQLLLKPDKTKLYVAFSQPLNTNVDGSVANCIMRVAMPMELTHLVSGGENQ